VMPDSMPTIGVVVMPNMLDQVVDEVYDIKGSSYGRFTRDKDKEGKGIANIVQKDLDCKFNLLIPAASYKRFKDQIIADVQFLESLCIMDYSLLLGVKSLPEGEYTLDEEGWPVLDIDVDEWLETSGRTTPPKSLFQRDMGGLLAYRVEYDDEGNTTSVEPALAYFGIIDILQTYDPAKFTEHWFKRLYINKNDVSVTKEDAYARRFRERMLSLFQPSDAPPPIVYREMAQGRPHSQSTASARDRGFSEVSQMSSRDCVKVRGSGDLAALNMLDRSRANTLETDPGSGFDFNFVEGGAEPVGRSTPGFDTI